MTLEKALNHCLFTNQRLYISQNNQMKRICSLDELSSLNQNLIVDKILFGVQSITIVIEEE